jgi:flagellar protein FliO/FliZ
MRFPNPFIRGAALTSALTLIPASVADAASDTGESTPLHLQKTAIHHVSSSGGSGILRTIIALIIVIALIYVVARVLKAVKGGQQRASGDGLDHVATLPLGPNKSVTLVRSGSDLVLVGVSESGVTPIKTYTEEEALANGLITPEQAEPLAPRQTSFVGFLDTIRKITVRT